MQRSAIIAISISVFLALILSVLYLVTTTDEVKCHRICVEQGAVHSRVFSIPNYIFGGDDVFCACTNEQNESVYSTVLHISTVT